MTRWLTPLLLWLALAGTGAGADTLPHWSPAQLAQLQAWLAAAPAEALPALDDAEPVLKAAIEGGDAMAIDATATATAVRLLEAEYNGCCNAALRTGWKIAAQVRPDAGVAVANAIAADRIDALYTAARPSHPQYVALRTAYAAETDPARRATIAANMDRWRWMPRDLGQRYVLVNAAAFEATLWDSGAPIGRWKVIVGKTRLPTPVFNAVITGVNFNPWWEIPKSIVAESVGSMMRKRPGFAAQQGYVIQNGRYRQRPGPKNSLGLLKLVMPNPYNVYLHDTPARSLFERDVRAFSHGCVRVGDAIGLAATLLERDRADVDALIASGETQIVPLPRPMPVYIAYFTAEADATGTLQFVPDIYKRDTPKAASAPDDPRCKS